MILKSVSRRVTAWVSQGTWAGAGSASSSRSRPSDWSICGCSSRRVDLPHNRLVAARTDMPASAAIDAPVPYRQNKPCAVHSGGKAAKRAPQRVPLDRLQGRPYPVSRPGHAERPAAKLPLGRAPVHLGRHPGAVAVRDAVLDGRMYTIGGFAIPGPGLAIQTMATLSVIVISSRYTFRHRNLPA